LLVTASIRYISEKPEAGRWQASDRKTIRNMAMSARLADKYLRLNRERNLLSRNRGSDVERCIGGLRVKYSEKVEKRALK